MYNTLSTEMLKACNKDMGMTNGGIEDFQITASSSRAEHTPSMARLTDDYGWCASNYDVSPYIQVSDQVIPYIQVCCIIKFSRAACPIVMEMILRNMAYYALNINTIESVAS